MRFFCAKVSVALPKIAMCRHAELQRPVEAALVGHQHRAVAGPASPEQRHQLGGVGELGHPLRVHEAGRLDDRQPGGEQAADELGLDLGRDQRLLVLQAVARADLVDRDPLGHRRDRRGVAGTTVGVRIRPLLVRRSSSGSTTNSRAPSATWSPAAASTAVDGAGERRLERQLHLHRLHHAEHVALGHDLAGLDAHVEHGAGHRRERSCRRRRRRAWSAKTSGRSKTNRWPWWTTSTMCGCDVDDRPLATAVDVEHARRAARRGDLRATGVVVDPAAGPVDQHRLGRARPRSAPGRRPSASRRPGTGARRPCSATSIAWIQAAKTPGQVARSGAGTVVLVEPGGVDGRVAELVARGQRPQEAGVGGEPEDRGVVEGGDQRPAGGLAVGAVDDDLAEHRVVRRADDLAALERVRRPGRRAGQRTSVAVPACGRKPPKESSA